MAGGTVLIYRSELLKYSEQWIKTQAEAMRIFCPLFVYSSFINQIQFSSEQIIQVKLDDFWRPTLPLSLGPACHFQYLKERLKDRKLSLLYAHFGPDAVEALPIAEALNIPMVVAFHGYDATMHDDVLREGNLFLRRFLFWRNHLKEKASLFICDSDFIADKLIQKGFPSDKIKTHFIGTELPGITAEISENRENFVLFAGELAEKTGCEYLIRAMSKVQQTLPLLRLVIAGQGQIEQSLKDLADNLSVNIEFKGAASNQSIYSLMKTALIYCLPGIEPESGECDGLPLTLLEAQALGCPVVSSRHSGIPDAVIPGITAELVEEKNVEQLVQAILLFASSVERRKLAAREGPSFIREKFNIIDKTRILESYFEELISSTGLQAG